MATGGVLNYIINFNTGGAMAGFNQVESAIKGLKSSMMSLAASAGIFDIGSKIADGVKEAAKAGWEFDATMEQLQMSFGTLLRSADEAKAMLSDLRAYSDVTPFRIQNLADASEMMLAFGMEGKKVLPTLQMLGDVSLGSNEKLQHLAYAFSEVAAQGQLMGRHVLMMVNSGFNPLQVISEKTGVTMDELKKKMEEGKISVDMVQEAFRIATAEGGRFYQGMEKASKTFNGQMTTIKDHVLAVFGGVMEPLFEKISKTVLPELVHAVKGFREYLPEIGRAIETNIMPQLEVMTKTFMYFLGLYEGAGKNDSVSTAIQDWTKGIGSAIKGIMVFGEGVRNAWLIMKTLGEGIIAFGAITAAAFVAIKAIFITCFDAIRVVGHAVVVGLSGIIMGLGDIVQGVVLGISGAFEWCFKSIMDLGRQMSNGLAKVFQDVWIGVTDGFATVVNPLIAAKDKLLGTVTEPMKYSTSVTTDIYTDAQMHTAGKNSSWDLMKENNAKMKGLMNDLNTGLIDDIHKASTETGNAWADFMKSDTLKQSSETLKNLGADMRQSLSTILTSPDLTKVDDFIKGLAAKDKIKPPNIDTSALGEAKDLMDMLKAGTDKAAKGAASFATKFREVGKELHTQTMNFANFIGLFDRVERKGPSSGEALLRRLQTQTKEMVKWQASMQTLQTRIGADNPELMDQLRKMGPTAQRQITGLSKLSDAKLGEYTRLFGQKASIGFQEAKAVVKYEHSGVILVKGVNTKDQLQEIAEIVAADMERDLNRQSLYGGAGKLVK